MRGAAATLLLVLLGATLPAGQPVRAQDPPRLNEVKAAFLYHFARFVEWPSGALDRPFRVCVAAEDVFHGSLAALFEGELVHGRPAEVVTIQRPDNSCHMLFVPNRPATEIYLRAARDRAVLTIGETPNFLSEGGIIRLFLEGGSVRFAVNLDAAQRGGLRLSSRLVELARTPRAGAE